MKYKLFSGPDWRLWLRGIRRNAKAVEKRELTIALIDAPRLDRMRNSMYLGWNIDNFRPPDIADFHD